MKCYMQNTLLDWQMRDGGEKNVTNLNYSDVR